MPITLPGTLGDYPVGSVTIERRGKFYLSHVPEGFLALYWKCTHLGCTVPYKANEEFEGNSGVFMCPCHGSVYLRNGLNVAGPTERPLDLMEVQISGNKIVVDTGKIRKRTDWDPSDAVKP
jgi:cytochrome b6-f complex iron-sulfur subunit